MNRNTFRLATLLRRSRECRPGAPVQVMFLVCRSPTRGWDQPHHCVCEEYCQLVFPRIRGLIVTNYVLHSDWFVGAELLVVVESPEYFSGNREDAHPIADAVRGS